MKDVLFGCMARPKTIGSCEQCESLHDVRAIYEPIEGRFANISYLIAVKKEKTNDSTCDD
jgi:hypothetical protein